MRRMRPRLLLQLGSKRLTKAPTPPTPLELGDHLLPRLRVHQIRPFTHIVIHGSQLDQLPQKGDGADGALVLVADDGLGDGFGLGLRAAELVLD